MGGMQVARTFAAQIYECHEMLEDEIMPIRIQDPHLRRLVALELGALEMDERDRLELGHRYKATHIYVLQVT